VGKQMNDYPKVVDGMVDEGFAKSNPSTILSAKYFARRRSKYYEKLAWRETDDEMIRELE
jgi:hypothetical protein